ncbi:MAG: hypothetical protein ACXVA9_14245, partial [Bdellovibrionales bacterium]
MRGGSAFLLSLILLACTHVWAGVTPDTEIRVRLKKHAEAVDITGTDLRISPPSAFIETEGNAGFHRAKITRKTNGTWIVKWDHIKKAVKIHAERLWVRGGLIRVGLEPAPYDLE